MRPDYYVHDFLLVLDTVLERDEHLFFPAELEVFYRIRTLPRHELRLLVRLFNRRRLFVRVDRLHYADIPVLHQVLESLDARGLVKLFLAGQGEAGRNGDDPVWTDEDFKAALKAYTVPELARVAGLAPSRTLRRTQVMEAVDSLGRKQAMEGLLAEGGLVSVVHRDLLRRVQRLFFLNSRQDPGTLVTVDLALVRFPSYRVWRTGPVFPDRRSFDAFLEAEALRDTFESAVHSRNEPAAAAAGKQAFVRFLDAETSAAGFLERFEARYVLAGTALAFVRRCERTHGATEAATMYEQLLHAGLPGRYRGRAWRRLALLRERQHDLAGALAACARGLDEQGLRRGDRVDLVARSSRILARASRQGRRVAGASGHEDGTTRGGSRGLDGAIGDGRGSREVVVQRPIVASGRGRRMLFEDVDGRAQEVEQLALAAYRAAGVDGVVSENQFFTTLFGVLFWDILFAPIPDVFQTPYQDAPLDLGTDAFYATRRDAIEARLRQIGEEGAGERILREHDRRFRGVLARGVAWERFSEEALAEGVVRLGGKRLVAVLGPLARDYRSWRRGLPDLLLWRSEGGFGGVGCGGEYWAAGGYEVPGADVWFAEVKSPRDRVGPHQKAWIATLRRAGLWVEVCRVVGEDCVGAEGRADGGEG